MRLKLIHLAINHLQGCARKKKKMLWTSEIQDTKNIIMLSMQNLRFPSRLRDYKAICCIFFLHSLVVSIIF